MPSGMSTCLQSVPRHTSHALLVTRSYDSSAAHGCSAVFGGFTVSIAGLQTLQLAGGEYLVTTCRFGHGSVLVAERESGRLLPTLASTPEGPP